MLIEYTTFGNGITTSYSMTDHAEFLEALSCLPHNVPNIPVKIKLTKNKPSVYKSKVIGKMHKYKPLSKYIGFEGKKRIRAGTTFIGVEVELEQVEAKSAISGTWSVVEDHSLKNNGHEFVTIPIQFKYLEVELKRLFSGITSCKTSSRCSIHIHLNARDFTTEELQTFIILYMIFEKSLYNFSGNRWNNNFCVPLAFYPQTVKDAMEELSNGYTDLKWYKYFGLNLSPIFGGESTKLGTIEFRHMAGTTNVDYILDWINLIVSLKITAKKMDYVTIMEHLRTMNTTSGYYWLAEHTFKDFKDLIITQDTFKQDVENCIARAKTVLLSDKFNQEEYIKITTIKGGVNCVDLSL